jgi:predicted NAD-dependent protein-ADP-ribosyltransferase YbiA (DUF1768 family)
MIMSRYQNVGQRSDIKTANKTFQNVTQLRNVGMTATNQKLIQEKIKSRLYLGNDWYQSVQNLLPSALLFVNENIRVNQTVILILVLYG